MESVTELQALGVTLTHEGKYVEAEKAFRDALSVLEITKTTLSYDESQRLEGAILRDLADCIRRDPLRVYEATVLLIKSASIFSVTKNRLDAAYTMHYLGRLERQLGNFTDALSHINSAYSYLHAYILGHPVLNNEVCAQQLYIGLDLSSVYALNKRPIEALFYAIRSLNLTRYYGTKAHSRRALVLCLFAFWPNCPLEIVRRAYFGGVAN